MERPRLIAKRRLTRRTLLKAGCSGALLLCGCVREPEPPLRIGTSLWPGHAPLLLGRTLGYLKGKPLKLVEYFSAPEIYRAFQNGAVDLAALTADQFLRMSATVPGLRAVLVMDYSDGADALLGNPGIALENLQGRRVGVEPNSGGAYFLCRALDEARQSRGAIELVPVRSNLHGQAFRNNTVDALVAFEPYRSQLLREGAEVLFDSRKIKSEMPTVLAVREEVLRERSGLLRELAAAWFQAREYLLAKRSEASTVLSPRYGAEPAEFEQWLELISFPNREANQELLADGTPKLEEQLATIREHMIRHELLGRDTSSQFMIHGGLVA